MIAMPADLDHAYVEYGVSQLFRRGVNQFGSSHQVEVQLAKDGVRPIFWQACGAEEDDHEYGVLRVAAPRRETMGIRASLG